MKVKVIVLGNQQEYFCIKKSLLEENIARFTHIFPMFIEKKFAKIFAKLAEKPKDTFSPQALAR